MYKNFPEFLTEGTKFSLAYNSEMCWPGWIGIPSYISWAPNSVVPLESKYRDLLIRDWRGKEVPCVETSERVIRTDEDEDEIGEIGIPLLHIVKKRVSGEDKAHSTVLESGLFTVCSMLE